MPADPVIAYLAERVGDAIQQAMNDHENPLLVISNAPAVLAALAGTHALTLYRVGALGDGELDALLAAIKDLLTDAADPSQGFSAPDLDISLRALRTKGPDPMIKTATPTQKAERKPAYRWQLRFFVCRKVKLEGRSGRHWLLLETVWTRYSMTHNRRVYLAQGDPFPANDHPHTLPDA